MPYTPPSHRSPASTAPPSPHASRRPSLQPGGSRPALPRSASYLTRHRRTPSAVSASHHGPIHQPTPEATSEDLKGMVTGGSHGSVRQSPPPVTDERGMPTGAIMSPPDSLSGSDEDELPEVRGRKLDNLRELQDAISQIPQHRESSPPKTGLTGETPVESPQSLTAPESLHLSFSTSSLDDLAKSGRKISHSRSNTEPHALVTKSADNSLTVSEEESEDELLKKPQMVRKKSGELVRPALRPPSRRRPSSMPGTPTFSKAVHFDSHLEHVRHFLQVDRPLAVSAGSSPVDNYDSDVEYPFPGEERRTPPYEWEIIVTNFPGESPARKYQVVRLERVWLSDDQKSLTGSVAVTNLAFHKYVTCRFTLDYWKTTSEIGAEYVAEIVPRETPQGQDRFKFTIKLSDLANLESKTLYLCIRYNVNGQEFWDNNDGTNFQVDFRKKMLPQKGKNNFQGAASRTVSGLPRSNRRSNPSTAPRPKSMPVAFDEFGDNARINFDQSLHDYLGEPAPALRLKGVKSTTSLPSDNLTGRLSSPSGQAFANRYDFGASLVAAVQAAKDSAPKSDGLYMKQGRKTTAPLSALPSSRPKPRDTAATNHSSAGTKALPALSTGTEGPASPSIASATYEEIVNKYCFFGSKQSSPQLKDGTMRSGQVDGASDMLTRNTNSSNSSSTGSPMLHMATYRQHGTQHHTLHPHDPNPYFQHAMASFGPSSVSPLKNSIESPASPSSTSQPRNPASVSGTSTARSVSPASLVGSFPPFAAIRG